MKHYSVHIASYFLGLLTAFGLVFGFLLHEDKKIMQRKHEELERLQRRRESVARPGKNPFI